MSEDQKSSNENNSNNRRDFLGMLLGGGFFAWIISLFYPVFKFLEPPKIEEVKVSSVKIGAVEDMEKDSGKIIKFGKKPVIVIRKTGGEYIAFAGVCTHLDCIVQFRKDYGQIYCACHNGRYDLNGRNVSGPPPSPLKKFGVNIKDGEVIVYEQEA